MKHLIPKTMTAVPVLALALAVGGCGSSSDDDDVMAGPTPEEMCTGAGGEWMNGECTTADELAEAEALDEAQMDAMTAATAADTAADAAEMAANAQMANMAHDEASYTLAQDAAKRAREASNAAAAANTAAQAATTSAAAQAQRDIAQRHQGTAETERNNAVKYAGMVADAKMAADDAAAAAAAKAAANKVAATKKAAIATEADPTTTAARPFDLTTAPSDLTAPTDTENYVVTLKHTGSAVEVTVLDGALDADNDPMYESEATFADGQMLVRDIGTDRKIIVLHSDIEAPTDVAFSSEYTLTVDRDEDTTANDTYAVLEDDNGKIESPDFPSGASTSKTYVEYDADTAAGRMSQFSGEFDGASGMYRCIASGGCTVSTDAMGDFNALIANQWEFTPTPGATVSKSDPDYMTYGFWLDTTTKDGAVVSYDTVQTFATSSLAAADALGTVTGTATYEGGAAGVYVHETKKEDGTLDTATSGRFTADVALKAYFVAVTPRVDNAIEGTISDFELEGGPDNSWSVDVSATFTDGGVLTGAASGMAGDDGSLSGQFHGPNATDDTVAPMAVVGEFNANFVNGVAAGAYGARKQP